MLAELERRVFLKHLLYVVQVLSEWHSVLGQLGLTPAHSAEETLDALATALGPTPPHKLAHLLGQMQMHDW